MAKPGAYAILGVPSSATASQIKRAYRAKSLALHPDKNPGSTTAAAAFNDVASAYHVLSTPARRAEYDESLSGAYVAKGEDDPFADAGYRQAFAEGLAETLGKEGAGVDAGEVFESLFGKTRAGMGHSAGGEPSAPRPESRGSVTEEELRAAAADAETGGLWKPPDHEVDLPLTLVELFSGCVKKRRLRKQVLDTSTNSFTEHAEILNIHVRPGYRPGDKIRFHEASDHGHGIIPADVVFVISALPHARFAIVEGTSDLKVDVTLGLADALAGALIKVEPLVGDAFSVRTNDVVQPGQTRRVRGRGMPKQAVPTATAVAAADGVCDVDGRSATGGSRNVAKNKSAYGDLLIRFNVAFPPTLNGVEKVRVREVLMPIEERTGLGGVEIGLVNDGGGSTEGPNGSMRRTSSMFSTATTSKRTRSAHSSASVDAGNLGAPLRSSRRLRQVSAQGLGSGSTSPGSPRSPGRNRAGRNRAGSDGPASAPKGLAHHRNGGGDSGARRPPRREDAAVGGRRASPVLDTGDLSESSSGSTRLGDSAAAEMVAEGRKRENSNVRGMPPARNSSAKTASRKSGAKVDSDDEVESVVGIGVSKSSKTPGKKKGFLASLGF